MAEPPKDAKTEPPSEQTRDIRYCPFCGEQEFDLTGKGLSSVYCEICGFDLEVRDLLR